jgi:hypothetical protein
MQGLQALFLLMLNPTIEGGEHAGHRNRCLAAFMIGSEEKKVRRKEGAPGAGEIRLSEGASSDRGFREFLGRVDCQRFGQQAVRREP